jgi:hydroxymethylpyrimidine/phosphomethylpyrimidine kinase
MVSQLPSGRQISTPNQPFLRYIHSMKVPPVVLSIAGFDPSSGAGITADVKTAVAHGCYAVTCPTALTVQSSVGVSEVRPVEPDLIERTLSVLAEDLEIAAVRVGMLSSASVAESVASALRKLELCHIVVDPVLRSSSGAALLDEPGLQVLKKDFLPLADVLTPNLDEAASLAGIEALPTHDLWEDVLPWLRLAAGKLHSMGSRSILITGGHLPNANDYLSCVENGIVREDVFPGAHIESRSTHGTGCALSMSIACHLALGRQLPEAIGAAKAYVAKAIRAAYPLGKGIGPLNHMV